MTSCSESHSDLYYIVQLHKTDVKKKKFSYHVIIPSNVCISLMNVTEGFCKQNATGMQLLTETMRI